MKKPTGWDTAPAYDGEYERLPAGGYVCTIQAARIEMKKDREFLSLALDIAEGDFKGFYGRAFERKKAREIGAKWPCVFYQLTESYQGETNPYFKGLIESVTKSNTGYTWTFDEATLRGKKIGFIFGEEEWQTNDGEIKTSIKPLQARSVEAIRKGVQAPPVKRLATTRATPAGATSGFEPVKEDEYDLPF